LSDKRHYGRFCIQFNTDDARHVQVIELLEAQGRHKAQYVAEAVLCYIDREPSSDTQASDDSSALRQAIEAVVRDCLRGMRLVGEDEAQDDLPKDAGDLPQNDVPLGVDDDLFCSIQESMAALRDGCNT